LKAAAKAAAATFSCYRQAASARANVSPSCLGAAASTLAKLFDAADAIAACNGDAHTIADLLASAADSSAAILVPSGSQSKCGSTELSAIGRRLRQELIASSAMKLRFSPRLPHRITSARAKFNAAINAASDSGDCVAPADSPVLTSDLATLLSIVRQEINGPFADLVFDSAKITTHTTAPSANESAMDGPVTLTGVLRFTPTGLFSGQVRIAYGTQGLATIVISPAAPVNIYIGTTRVWLQKRPSLWILNDSIGYDYHTVLGQLLADVASGSPPDTWNPLSQSLFALMSIAATAEWRANAAAAGVPLSYPANRAGLNVDSDQAGAEEQSFCEMENITTPQLLASLGGAAACLYIEEHCAPGEVFTYFLERWHVTCICPKPCLLCPSLCDDPDPSQLPDNGACLVYPQFCACEKIVDEIPQFPCDVPLGLCGAEDLIDLAEYIRDIASFQCHDGAEGAIHESVTLSNLQCSGGEVQGSATIVEADSGEVGVTVTLIGATPSTTWDVEWVCTNVAFGCHDDACGFQVIGQIDTDPFGYATASFALAGNPYPGRHVHLDVFPKEVRPPALPGEAKVHVGLFGQVF
jgi:hypothetical protein